MTLYDQLIDDLVAKLQANANIISEGGKVERGRVNPLEKTDYPFYGVFLGDDQPLSDLGPDNVAFIDWEVEIFVECYSRVKLTDVDRAVLAQRANVHETFMADVTQGLSFVLTTIPAGAIQPTLDGEGAVRNAVYRLSWVFRVRSNIGQISSFP